MPRDLSPITRALKKETCPRRVRDEVQRRVDAQGQPRGWLRLALPAVATGLVLTGCLLVWRWPADRSARPQTEAAARTTHDRVQVASQAADALELVGSLVASAGVQSEKVISDRTVPPLRNSLQQAKNKIIQHIEL